MALGNRVACPFAESGANLGKLGSVRGVFFPTLSHEPEHPGRATVGACQKLQITYSLNGFLIRKAEVRPTTEGVHFPE